ncbi:hypothetical protein DFP72DRAFT_1082465 [Ephemerocybe angulata]|uniref:Uncharacterized protein n=1 Tax=Ephemerocybe angulata TaxID=980116 RepID=A0A8H6H9P4_9AGAR|nr:hypothetical protein DFP72DRAFT_1082465 [Tulosesus angulatus]
MPPRLSMMPPKPDKNSKAGSQRAAKAAVTLAGSSSSTSISSSSSGSSKVHAALGKRLQISPWGGDPGRVPRLAQPLPLVLHLSLRQLCLLAGSVEKMRCELEELHRFKEARLAEDDDESDVEPIVRPKGEANRSGKGSKPGFNLCEKSGIEGARFRQIGCFLVRELLPRLKIPRGAHITDPKWAAHLSDMYKSMEAEFPELNKQNFPDYWVVR